jgi:hypothetical protein
MNYRIAIPSYKRPKIIKEKTLNYLTNICGINPEVIDVFVANESEFEKYKYLLNNKVNVIIGVLTINKQRKFIRNHYNEGSLVIQMDDDIDYLTIKKAKKTVIFDKLDKMIKIGFNECHKSHTKIFGINPTNNHFFMSSKISTNLKLINGGFFGQIIDKDKYLDIFVEEKDDYETTIRYFLKFNKVVRLNMFSLKTTYYKGEGGMVDNRTKEEQHKSALYLCKKYPDYIKINPHRKSEYTELRLNSRAI